ncbi:hypothetical protein [Mucilaginibacter sp.]
MDELIISEDRTIAYIPGHQVAISMQSEQPAAQPTTGTVNIPFATNISRIAYWGEDNNFPGMIQALLANDAEMTKLLDWAVRAAMGKGISVLQIVDWDDDGLPIYKPIKDPDIQQYFTNRSIRMYTHKAFIDLFTFFNVFPELITTKDRSQIYSIGINQAMHCRWEQMGMDGKLKNVVHNKNFGVNAMVNLSDPTQTEVIPAIDPFGFNLVDTVRANKSLTKFIFPVNYPTIGRTYYQVAHWDGLRVSGWLEIAAKVPAFKKALMENQMTIKYLIRIPNNYWPSVYKDWDNMKDAARSEAKKKKMREIDKTLTDTKNAGKSIMNEVGFDPVTKEKLPGWEIDVINDKTSAGAFLEDSQEASAHKMRALGLDNSLVGALETGKKMGGGSGSDKLQAWNIFLALISPYRDVVLDPLYFAAEFNGYIDRFPGFTIAFRDTILQTQNINNQVTQEIAN